MTRLRALALGSVLAACATASAAPDRALAQAPAPATPAAPAAPAPGAEVQAVRERAAAFWAARMNRDFKGQWELYEPRLKGRMTPEEYARTRGVLKFLGYEVEGARIEGVFATVDVRVIAEAPLTAPGSRRRVATLVPDKWIKVDGVWYRREDQETVPPPEPSR